MKVLSKISEFREAYPYDSKRALGIGLLLNAVLFMLLLAFYIKSSLNVGSGVEIIPQYLHYGISLMVLSSVMLYLSNRYRRKEDFIYSRNLLIGATVLGMSFCGLLLLACYQLQGAFYSDAVDVRLIIVWLIFSFYTINLAIGLVLLVSGSIDSIKHSDTVNGFIATMNPFMNSRNRYLNKVWYGLSIFWAYLYLMLS